MPTTLLLDSLLLVSLLSFLTLGVSLMAGFKGALDLMTMEVLYKSNKGAAGTLDMATLTAFLC